MCEKEGWSVDGGEFGRGGALEETGAVEGIQRGDLGWKSGPDAIVGEEIATAAL